MKKLQYIYIYKNQGKISILYLIRDTDTIYVDTYRTCRCCIQCIKILGKNQKPFSMKQFQTFNVSIFFPQNNKAALSFSLGGPKLQQDCQEEPIMRSRIIGTPISRKSLLRWVLIQLHMNLLIKRPPHQIPFVKVLIKETWKSAIRNQQKYAAKPPPLTILVPQLKIPQLVNLSHWTKVTMTY